MATRITEVLVDDLDGATAEETVVFGIDATTYEIDLSMANATKMRDALAPYVQAARKTGRLTTQRRRAVATPLGKRDRDQQIRAWVRGQGIKISDRGRLAKVALQAWETKDPTKLDSLRKKQAS